MSTSPSKEEAAELLRRTGDLEDDVIFESPRAAIPDVPVVPVVSATVPPPESSISSGGAAGGGGDIGGGGSSSDDIPAEFRHRLEVLSEQTGIDVEKEVTGDESHMKSMHAASDVAVFLNLKPEEVKAQLERVKEEGHQPSSADCLDKSRQGTMHDQDLRLAEEIGAYGRASVRNITEQQENKLIEQDHDHEKDDFVFNLKGLTSEEAARKLKEFGPNALPDEQEPKWKIFCKQLIAPMPLVIWVTVIIEGVIHNFLDMSVLLFIQFANALIGFYEMNKAGDAVAALKQTLKPTATVKRDGAWLVIPAADLVPGDTVLLGSGSAIPADCRVNAEEIDVDQSTLTGESLPVTFYKGDACKMGSTVVRGEVEATVEFTGVDTFFGKTAALLNTPPEHSNLDKILLTITLVLVTISVVLSTIYFVYILESDGIRDALTFTVVILVASIPLAIEIVTTTTLAIGSKNLARHGAIVTKLSAIEDLAGMSILCSDKTGTLTLNKMVLQDDTPIYEEGETQASVLTYAAMAAKWKEPPRDALDRLTLGAVDMDSLIHYAQVSYLPFDPQIKRTEGTVKDTRSGKVFKTSKGAPHIILRLLPEEDSDVRDKVEADVAHLGALGIRTLAVAKTESEGGPWKMMGLLTFLDPPRNDTKQTLMEAVQYGVDVKMVTGDHLLIARNAALTLGMGDLIFTAERLPLLDPETKSKPADLSETYGDLCLVANGFAQVYPEHKYLIVECLRELGYTVGFTGDGVNDAPALKRADIGIAVSGSTDAARAAADIVLTEEGLSTIIHAIVIARKIFQRVNSFITYRIAATLQLLVFFFISVFAFHPNLYTLPPELQLPEDSWPEFFHMPVIMLMLITLLNDGTLISIAYDTTEASPAPNRWNLPALFVTASTLGIASCASSLVLLHFMLDSWHPQSLFAKLRVGGVHYGQIITAIYLKISISDFLTLFSARTGPKFFFQVRPAIGLVAGASVALAISSVLSIFLPENYYMDEIVVTGLQSDMKLFGFVWIISIVAFLIQDALKVLVFKLMELANFNDITRTGVVVLPESAKNLVDDMEIALDKEATRFNIERRHWKSSEGSTAATEIV